MTGYEAVYKDAAWLDLSARGRLMVTGEDAGRLLHAISTNDIKGLGDGEGIYTFFLSAQGRILADAYIFRRGSSFLLDTEPEVAEKLREHIDKYIIADDAEIAAVAGWSELSIEGPRAVEGARELNVPVAEQTLNTREWMGGFTAHVGSVAAEGVRVFGPDRDLAALRGGLSLAELSPTDARIVRLESGIARYGEDITERYLVQETGLLQAVSFSKGCYLGQEIVERVRSRAQVHRHLRSIRIQASAAPAPGTKLSFVGKDVGEITSAAYSPRLKQVVAMAYVRSEALDPGVGLTVAGTGEQATLVPSSPKQS